MITTKLSDQPINAPQDYRSLDRRVVIKNGDGLYETWHGSGVATDLACGHCRNATNNRQIYGNWGYSYPNGNSWDDREIVCGQCGKYTLVMEFTEG